MLIMKKKNKPLRDVMALTVKRNNLSQKLNLTY